MKSRRARAYHLSVITAKLDELADYHERIEAFIIREVATLHAQFEQGLAALAEEQRNERAEFFSDEHVPLSEGFTRTLRVSVLIAIYTFFETALDSLCAADQKRRGHTFALSDLAG